METKLAAKRYIKLAMVAILAITLACVALTRPAFADESSSAASASSAAEAAASESASAGEVAVSDSSPLGGLPMMGNDYVWFGRDLELSNVSIGNDLIAAGQVVNVKNCSVMGDFRIAAQDVEIKDSSAFENITAAGETVIIRNTDANAVALAGKAAAFSGACEELVVYAETVYIDGTVYGDVVVGANSVEIGTNARIMGTLHVSAPSDPVMQRGAEVADVEYTKSEGSAASTAEIESAVSELASTFMIFMIVMSIIGTLVVAVLAEWLFRRQTAGAAEMIRTRTGAHIGTGIVGALVAPLAVIILLCLGITIPVAGGIAFALFAMTCVATGFAGASLFKLAFPKLGRFKCALAGGAIMGVAGAIPILGSIVGVLAFMYLLGYVLQSIYLGMRDPGQPAPVDYDAAPVAPTAPMNVASVASAPVTSAVPENTAPIVSENVAFAAPEDTAAIASAASPSDEAPADDSPTQSL